MSMHAKAIAFIGLIAMAIGSPACMAEDADGLQLEQKYPPGTIRSVDQADLALKSAAEARQALQRRFETDQQACYSKFLATSCLNDAKEKRRLALLRVRRVEVQANEFKRTERAQERDKEIAAREREAAARAEAGAGGLQVMVNGVPQTPGQPDSQQNDARVAQHEARLKHKEDQDAADEKKREKNVAAYEKKVQEAKERQRSIDAKKSAEDK